MSSLARSRLHPRNWRSSLIFTQLLIHTSCRTSKSLLTCRRTSKLCFHEGNLHFIRWCNCSCAWPTWTQPQPRSSHQTMTRTIQGFDWAKPLFSSHQSHSRYLIKHVYTRPGSAVSQSGGWFDIGRNLHWRQQNRLRKRRRALNRAFFSEVRRSTNAFRQEGFSITYAELESIHPRRQLITIRQCLVWSDWDCSQRNFSRKGLNRWLSPWYSIVYLHGSKFTSRCFNQNNRQAYITRNNTSLTSQLRRRTIGNA